MSLLDDRQRVVASSNPANVGLTMATQSYLPQSTGAQETLRIGQPWAGRDFARRLGQLGADPGRSRRSELHPLTLTLTLDERAMTLLVALNPDYFISHIAQKLDASEGSVDVLRYDGTLLMSSDPARQPGAQSDVRQLRLPEVESANLNRTRNARADGLPRLASLPAGAGRAG